MSSQQQKVMVPPINQIFKFLQQNSKVSIWLYQNRKVRITGIVRGFDEFMNLVLDNAVQINVSEPKDEREIGMMLIKGDTISLISCIS